MGNSPHKYDLDKTIFHPMKVEESNDRFTYWKNKTLRERLEAACYLINQFYNTSPQSPIDKTIFNKRKHANF